RLQLDESVDIPLCCLELSSVDVDRHGVDRAAGKRESGEAQPLLREMGLKLEHLVPMAEREERIRLAEKEPLPVAVPDSTCKREAVACLRSRIFETLDAGERVSEVEVRPERRRGLVVLEGDLERVAHQGHAFLGSFAREEKKRLRVESL